MVPAGGRLEKRKPSYDLRAFQNACGSVATIRITRTAQISARHLGFDLDDVAAVIRSMDRRMFYKSMTSFTDHTAWQDVYHVPAGDGVIIYLKFTMDTLVDFMVLSFKEK
jgi:motility quorum-sensing regulator/GCU-specific mRNA interferase toxin